MLSCTRRWRLLLQKRVSYVALLAALYHILACTNPAIAAENTREMVMTTLSEGLFRCTSPQCHAHYRRTAGGRASRRSATPDGPAGSAKREGKRTPTKARGSPTPPPKGSTASYEHLEASRT